MWIGPTAVSCAAAVISAACTGSAADRECARVRTDIAGAGAATRASGTAGARPRYRLDVLAALGLVSLQRR